MRDIFYGSILRSVPYLTEYELITAARANVLLAYLIAGGDPEKYYDFAYPDGLPPIGAPLERELNPRGGNYTPFPDELPAGFILEGPVAGNARPENLALLNSLRLRRHKTA